MRSSPEEEGGCGEDDLLTAVILCVRVEEKGYGDQMLEGNESKR